MIAAKADEFYQASINRHGSELLAALIRLKGKQQL